MGTYAKTVILLLLLVYLDPFIGRVKGLEHGVNSATNEDMIEVKMRKLILEVDVQRDYPPGHSNTKHDPPPPAPRRKSGTSAGGGS